MCSELYQNSFASEVKNLDIEHVNSLLGREIPDSFTLQRLCSFHDGGWYVGVVRPPVVLSLLWPTAPEYVPGYFLGSKYYFEDDENYYVYALGSEDDDGALHPMEVFSSPSGRVRPVVTLKTGLEKIRGDGSSSTPYEFE